ACPRPRWPRRPALGPPAGRCGPDLRPDLPEGPAHGARLVGAEDRLL
ncbi:MAG: hypothetical protein AVDCRST_MAG27-1887, partial [uncultured Craurococcus sp.]